jgi:glycosyltransferase involved in cell wall biosynthesis
MSGMRIAYVYDAAYPFVKGGGEKRIYEIARRLSKKHEVDWITLKWWEDGNEFFGDGIRYIGVGEWKNLYAGGRRSISEAIYFGIKALPSLLSDYDVVDCTAFPYFPAFSSRFSSIVKKSKLFITWHEVWDDYWYEYLGWKGFFGKIVERRVTRLKAKHIAVSKLTAEMLESKGCETITVPNGVNLDLIESIRPSGEYDIVFAGRLIEEKGVDLFIQLCKILSKDFDFKAVIIGEGPLKKEITEKAEQKIEVIPFVDEERFYSILKGAKLFVLPSRREGFGISALEAIACSTPVLTLKHPMNAAREIAEMYGFAAGSFEEMVEFGRKVLKGNFWGEKVKVDLQEYDWGRIAEKMERIYKEGMMVE